MSSQAIMHGETEFNRDTRVCITKLTGVATPLHTVIQEGVAIK